MNKDEKNLNRVVLFIAALLAQSGFLSVVVSAYRKREKNPSKEKGCRNTAWMVNTNILLSFLSFKWKMGWIGRNWVKAKKEGRAFLALPPIAECLFGDGWGKGIMAAGS
jgi:hypothetical protein